MHNKVSSHEVFSVNISHTWLIHNSFYRLYRTRCWPAAEHHRHHQEKSRGPTNHHVCLEPQRWVKMSLFLKTTLLLLRSPDLEVFNISVHRCRPAPHGSAPLPHPLPVLRVWWRAVVSAVPALGWHGPGSAFQHRQLCASHLHDRTRYRTKGTDAASVRPLVCFVWLSVVHHFTCPFVLCCFSLATLFTLWETHTSMWTTLNL